LRIKEKAFTQRRIEGDTEAHREERNVKKYAFFLCGSV
jgi:hypothetical protein